MIIKMFLVLILGFGPHVLLTSDNGNLEIRQHPWVLIEQGVQIITYQQSYGLFPRSTDMLAVNQQEENEAPIFAGASEFSQDGNTDRFAARQKEKPTGVDAWRTVV